MNKWYFVAIGLVTTAAGSWTYLVLGLHRHDGVHFKPSHLDIGDVRPGESIFEVSLVNSGHDRIGPATISGSCSCIDILSPRKSIDLPPDGMQRIQFRFTEYNSGNVAQALYIEDPLGRRIDTLHIDGNVASSLDLVSKEEGLNCMRVLNVEDGCKATLIYRVRSGDRVKRVSARSSKANMESIQTRDMLALRITDMAPDLDGRIVVPVVFDLKRGGEDWVEQRSVVVEASSRNIVENPSQWIGEVPVHAIAKVKFSISGPNKDEFRIGTDSSLKGTLSFINSSDGESTYEVRVRPTSPGYFEKQIPIYYENRRLGALRISGIAR